MTVESTIIPRSSNADNVTLETKNNALQIKETYEASNIATPISENQCDIIELHAAATLSGLTHDSIISDTMSDSNGYKNSVDTVNTTAAYGTGKYSVGSATSQLNDLVGSDTLTNNSSVTFSAGLVGNAAHFNGSNYLSRASIAGTIKAIAFWINPNSVSSKNIFGNYSTNNMVGYFDSVGHLSYQAASTHALITTGAISAETWTHVVIIADGTSSKIYVNGSLAALTLNTMAAGDSKIDFAGTTTFGKDGANLMAGYLDELMLFTTVPTTGEIAEMYNSGSGTAYANLSSGLQSHLAHAYNFEAGAITAKKVVITLPTITGTVTASELVCNCPERETGDSVTYNIKNATQSDLSLALNTKNTLANLTTNPTKIEMNLIPASSPTDYTPSLKTYCLKIWKA
jgi:hypothetical protein